MGRSMQTIGSSINDCPDTSMLTAIIKLDDSKFGEDQVIGKRPLCFHNISQKGL